MTFCLIVLGSHADCDLSQEVSQNKISTNLLSLRSLQPGAIWARLNQMESSMGQMSNQKEREGHAMKLAETVMQPHGGLNLHSNFYKEYPTYIKMSICRAG